MLDRRHSMALDEVFEFWRQLIDGGEHSLFKTADGIRTIDLAMEPSWRKRSPGPLVVNSEAWSKIRDELFQCLITRYPGYFLIFDEHDSAPLVPGADWPDRGKIELYPEGINRKTDAFVCSFDRLHPEIILAIRWHFGRGEQNSRPSMFERIDFASPESADDSAVDKLMDRFTRICEEEALKGKRKAREHWWQLYSATNSSVSAKEQRELRKQLLYLEAVWGCGDRSEAVSQ